MNYEAFAKDLLAAMPSRNKRFFDSGIIDAVASMGDANSPEEQARNLKQLRRGTWLYELKSEGLPEMDQTRTYNEGVRTCLNLLGKHGIGYRDASNAFADYCSLEFSGNIGTE